MQHKQHTKRIACVNSDKETLIESAIHQTIPIQFGQRNRRVFEFARRLRGIFDSATDCENLRPYVERWYQAALPKIRTKEFEETWSDFLQAWESIRLPAGSTLEVVKNLAMGDSFTVGKGDVNLDNVARLLRSAARYRGRDGVFFMDFRTMGKCVALSPVAARKIALKLVDRGLARIVEKGTPGMRGKATVWRWLGP
jgi:hypothetical protein